MSTRIDALHGTRAHGGRIHQSGTERFKQFMHTVVFWRERARQRRALRELSDALLKDIGVSRADAMREAGKAFWKD